MTGDVRSIAQASGNIIRRKVEGDERPRIDHLDIYGAPHDRRTCPVCQDHGQTPIRLDRGDGLTPSSLV